MKKTLILGVSTALVLTMLTGCELDKIKQDKDSPDYQKIERKVNTPVLYGPVTVD